MAICTTIPGARRRRKSRRRNSGGLRPKMMLKAAGTRQGIAKGSKLLFLCSENGYTLSTMLVVDVEASGIDPQKHSIVSVGALDIANPTNRFYMECRVWEGAHIMPDALAVNGFTKEQITDPTKP